MYLFKNGKYRLFDILKDALIQANSIDFKEKVIYYKATNKAPPKVIKEKDKIFLIKVESDSTIKYSQVNVSFK